MQYLDNGGFQHTTLKLAGGLAERGHRVWLVAQKLQGPLMTKLPRDVEPVSLGAGRNITGFLPLVRFLRQARPEIIISGLSHTNVLAVHAARLSRAHVKVVLTEHAPVSDLIKAYPSWRYRLLPWLVKHSYHHADAVVAVSKGVAADLSRYLPAGFPVSVIYNPVVPDDLECLAEMPAAMLEEASPEHGPLIVAVGRLVREKRFDTLIHALRLLPVTLNARVLILGDGPERAEIERLVLENGLQDRVALPGFVDNPFAYMRRARVLALTSEFEGLGNVLIEAMACGTSVVSTDCPYGPREILADGRYGALIPIGDAAALSRALLHAIEAPADPEMLRHRAADFSCHASVGQYQRLMERIVAPPTL